MIRIINSKNVRFLYCAPHTFYFGDDMAAMIREAAPVLAHVHVADTFNHKASSGLRYIVNPPGSQGHASTSTSTSARARSTGTCSSARWHEVGFDGIMTACVFAWEERAEEILALHAQGDAALRRQVLEVGGPTGRGRPLATGGPELSRGPPSVRSRVGSSAKVSAAPMSTSAPALDDIDVPERRREVIRHALRTALAARLLEHARHANMGRRLLDAPRRSVGASTASEADRRR